MQEYIREKILPRVEKPSRYLGTEWNSVHKDWDKTPVRMAFAFPDLYEVGMSHLGLAILYGVVNERENMLMERAFAPGPDLEEILRQEGLPLFSLESHQPLAEFDLLGFTLQYELSYTTVLHMLDLAGIPLLAAERGYGHPLVIGGGPGACNPEPLAPFFDCFVLGDGEEVLPSILEIVAELKDSPASRVDRTEFLRRAATLPGVYVPSFYEVSYREDGTIAEIKPLRPEAPETIQKAVVADLDSAYFPTRPIVPYLDVVHDRIMLEVMRGCTRGCRFCQAGAIYRPVRERDVGVLLRQAAELVRYTGHEEISLTSLSTADYSCIEALARSLAEAYAPRGIAVSLPSLRADAFSVRLAQALQQFRKKSTLTFAPEAGSQRLRDVINKGVTAEDLLSATGEAFAAGWHHIKLYFMIGLPTETDEDLEGIVGLARQVLEQGRRLSKGKRPTVTVSISSFVPKPHTPFQWEPQAGLEELKEKQRFLRSRLKGPGLRFSWHQPEMSFLEAVLARGDRRLAPVLLEAWRGGAKLEGWSEYFRYDIWQRAWESTGVDPAFYAYRRRDYDEKLPWDHLDFGVNKRFLVAEHRRALAGEITRDCRSGRCAACGVCPGLNVGLQLKGEGRFAAAD
ncbi:TIGR03960 family B12-binding radical SAM protein [Moorellaceae bacterium AZ2]